MSNTLKDKIENCVGMDIGIALINGTAHIGKLKFVGADYVTIIDVRFVKENDKPTNKTITVQCNIPFDKIIKFEFVDFDDTTKIPNIIELKDVKK